MSDGFPHQLIIFGPPGTSKSYKARKKKAGLLGVEEEQIIPVTFHAEFSYGEFVSRLLPLTTDGKVHYAVHAGPFLRALAQAYLRQLAAAGDAPAGNVVLLIDEINRGNCAEIFGDVFQLLDREDDGWSSYPVAASELTLQALRQEMQHYAPGHDFEVENPVNALIRERKLKLPPNLYLIGTMNTGDESIFFMDSAFKRRWNFEFSPADFEDVPATQKHASVGDLAGVTWSMLVGALNALIIEECPSPNLDDKLIGPWFVKARSTPARSIEACFPDAFQRLRTLAPRVKTPDRGSNYSDEFEVAFDELLAACDPAIAGNIRVFAKHDDKKAGRTIGLIGSKVSASGWVYYCSRDTNLIIDKDQLYIESFVDQLATQAGEPVTWRIGQDDIDGKLFLYLWDNVFDRDKSPLSRCLAEDGHALRTFGQFLAQRDAFIAACINRTVTDAAG